MAHRLRLTIAALLGVLAPGLAHAGETLAELVARVEALRANSDHAGAAELAAEGAAREDLAAAERVILGGLARQNFELSYQAGGPLTDLCKLAAVMRLVAPLDSAAGSAVKLAAAMDAEARLERAAGAEWPAVCAPASEAGDGAAGPSDSIPARELPGTASAPGATHQAVAPRAAGRTDRRVRAGVGTLVPGLVLFAPMAGLLAYRAAGERELAALRGKGRPATEGETAEAAALDQRHRAATAGAVVLGVTGAALVVTGVVLLTASGQQRRVAVAPWGARGLGGLVLKGSF